MNVDLKDLKQSNSGVEYKNGYRIVYFYDNYYKVGEYCKTIKGFMIGFAECNPIIDEDDIPNFISIDDLLSRYLLDVQDACEVAIYKTDGTCISKKSRNDSIKK